jgi:hypothetical protein
MASIIHDYIDPPVQAVCVCDGRENQIAIGDVKR